MKLNDFKSYKILVILFILGSLFFFNLFNNSINVSQGIIFGSTYLIKYKSKKNYQYSFDSIFKEINKSVNTYEDSSLISKWNNSKKGTKIDKHFKLLFNKSKIYYKLSNGFFDPTVFDLVNFYGFGNPKKNNYSNKKIINLLKFVGINNLKLYNNELLKKYPNIKLDFNSIAPGYTVDLIAEFFKKKKINYYLIDIGGEIKTMSNNKKYWKIGIEDPRSKINARKSIIKINLSNQSLATSGNYRKIKLSENGTIISHTINPKNGNANINNLLSVSVINNKTIDADAFATIGMLLGLEEAKKFYIKNKISSFLIFKKNNKIKTESIEKFNNYIIK